MTRALVSVVIAAYNSMPYLDETLRSLFGQSYRPLEVVVADDGSSDGTGDYLVWARRWLAPADVSLVYLANAVNEGTGHARNRGLRAASGDLLTVFDHDDVMLPGGIESRVRWLRENGGDAVYARRDRLIHQGSARVVAHRDEPFESDGFTALRSARDQLVYLRRRRRTFPHTTLLYRREVLGAVGFHPEARALLGMEHYGWLLKFHHHYWAGDLGESVLLMRRGHRPDHLALRWKNHPDFPHVFDTVLVPAIEADLAGG
ncbi:glycosyltransferase family 2 protein [Streptomyces sp. NPDC058694]|uniref:glycosyltransferase family 2 protein n=1 Tax=Streptomyces sp. NPDC058694 TaxID=3346603 RepID=UPI003664B5FE